MSRFTFVIAFLLLLTGAALNDQHGEESVYFNYYCYVVKPGVFAGGALLSLASVILGLIYYITLTSAKIANNQWGNPSVPNQGGIAMGQPQFPPQSTQEPVFVHEDTYIRRQFTWSVILCLNPGWQYASICPKKDDLVGSLGDGGFFITFCCLLAPVNSFNLSFLRLYMLSETYYILMSWMDY